MAISDDAKRKWNTLMEEINRFGKHVADLSHKVKTTNDSRFKKERKDIRQKIYELRRKIDGARGGIGLEMKGIAEKVPEVGAYARMILEKERRIQDLERREIELQNKTIRTAPEEEELKKTIRDLTDLNHSLVTEESNKAVLIERYVKGERSNEDIKELSLWLGKLDRINDALSKMNLSLGI